MPPSMQRIPPTPTPSELGVRRTVLRGDPSASASSSASPATLSVRCLGVEGWVGLHSHLPIAVVIGVGFCLAVDSVIGIGLCFTSCDVSVSVLTVDWLLSN